VRCGERIGERERVGERESDIEVKKTHGDRRRREVRGTAEVRWAWVW